MHEFCLFCSMLKLSDYWQSLDDDVIDDVGGETDDNVKVNELFGIGDDRCDIEVYLERRQVSKP